MKSEAIMVLTTVSKHPEALRLGRTLLEARLAACVQIEEIFSLYRWEGEIHEEPEWRLLIKSTPERYEELRTLLERLHPYKTPQIVALEADRVSEAYGRWLRECTASDPE